VTNVTVLDKPKDQIWSREESHKIVDRLGCHVERWTKVPYRLVAHITDARKAELSEILGHESFTVREISSRDMWKEES
jgi:hypothetical protein